MDRRTDNEDANMDAPISSFTFLRSLVDSSRILWMLAGGFPNDYTSLAINVKGFSKW